MKRVFAGFLLAATLTGCTFTLDTQRTELVPAPKDFRRVFVSIHDAALDGGEQAFVNASFFAAVKQAAPSATLVNSTPDLSLRLSMIYPVLQPRWYTLLTLGFLREYYQVGSLRVVNEKTGEILSIHSVTVKGRRVFPLNTDDYQEKVIPKLLDLVKAELKAGGLAASKPLQVELDEG